MIKLANRPLRLASVAAALSLLASCTIAQASEEELAPEPPWLSRPNIVFVLTDDLSNNLVPYLAEVEAMAAQGVTFDNYIVSDPQCCPSHPWRRPG